MYVPSDGGTGGKPAWLVDLEVNDLRFEPKFARPPIPLHDDPWAGCVCAHVYMLCYFVVFFNRSSFLIVKYNCSTDWGK